MTNANELSQIAFSLSLTVSASESTSNSQTGVTIDTPRHLVNCHNSVPLCDYVADNGSPSRDPLDGLKTLKSKNLRNPFLSYLNINHLRNKIIDLRHILQQIDIYFHK